MDLIELLQIMEGKTISIDRETIDTVSKSHEFLLEFCKDKIIYGINTGLGPMAQYKVDDDKQIELQYNLIRSHSAGAGDKLPDEFVKAGMICRYRSIMQGLSGIHPSTLLLLREMINKDIIPVIPEHGGVGASGDLVQLSHLALSLIGEGKVSYKGEIRPTAEVFEQNDLEPIEVKLREGLSLINGTSIMTGIASINIFNAKKLTNWGLILSAMMNEIMESFDDHFSTELNNAKCHDGQNLAAKHLRSILESSKLILKRQDHFYNRNNDEKIFKKKVQEYYSLRCIPQIIGPIIDTISTSYNIIENELNSVSDNPVIDVKNKTVHHGGNFHGDYISLEMDKLKIAITRLSMLSERQNNFLMNPNLNEKLPPFVNLGTLGLNLGVQGMQFTATSTTSENQTLSNPMYVHSIPNNNDNQDIVSLGTNSALITSKVIENTYQVLSIQLIGILQAIDYLNIDESLSDITKDVYQECRKIIPPFKEDKPLYEKIAEITQYLKKKKIDIPNK